MFWVLDNTLVDRVIMDVVQLLLGDCCRKALYWVVVLPPELVLGIVRVMVSSIAEHGKKPFFSAFLWILFYCF